MRLVFSILLLGVICLSAILAQAQPLGPVYYDNQVLFELRAKNGGDQGALERFAINNIDADGDGIPDDPNVLLLPNTEPAATINGGPDVYGQGWTTGPNPGGSMRGHINGGVSTPSSMDDLVINNSFQIYDADGVFSFTENIDDRVRMSVNNPGGEDHVDGNWNTRTYLQWNDNDGQGGGWYDIEIWSIEDGGGAGTAGGLGIGFDPTGSNVEANFFAIDGANWQGDVDPATGVGLRAVLLSPVPEPASMALWSVIGMLMAGFGYFRWQRRK